MYSYALIGSRIPSLIWASSNFAPFSANSNVHLKRHKISRKCRTPSPILLFLRSARSEFGQDQAELRNRSPSLEADHLEPSRSAASVEQTVLIIFLPHFIRFRIIFQRHNLSLLFLTSTSIYYHNTTAVQTAQYFFVLCPFFLSITISFF